MAKNKEQKRLSFSDNHPFNSGRESSGGSTSDSGTIKCANGTLQPIWCVEYLDNLIVIGCADGRLEFWEATTGRLKVILMHNLLLAFSLRGAICRCYLSKL